MRIRLAFCLILCVVCASASAQRLIMLIEPDPIPFGGNALMSVRLQGAVGHRFGQPVIDAPNMVVELLPPENGRLTNGNMQWRYMIAPIHREASRIVASLDVDGTTRSIERIVASDQSPVAPESSAIEDLTGRRFVRATVDKTEAFPHEQVAYTFQYYFENWLPTREPSQYGLPPFDGFTTVEIAMRGGDDATRETVDGREYFVEEVKIALFPLTAGTWDIPPTKLVLPSYAGNRSRELRTNALSVRVKPFPEPIPADFSGGVGEFTRQFRLIDASGKVGQATRFSVTITGQGNLQTLSDLPTPTVDGGTLYEPQITDNATITEDRIGGTRRLTYVYTPNRAGLHRIRVAPLVAFSPTQQAFVSSQPISHQLVVGEAVASADNAQVEAPKWSLGRKLFGFALPALAAVVLLFGVYGMVRRFRVRPTRAAKPVETTESADGALQRIRDLKPGDGKAVCRELADAIRACCAARYGAMTAADIRERLGRDGSQEALRLLKLLDECAEVEFAPVSLSSERQESLLTRARAAAEAFVAAS